MRLSNLLAAVLAAFMVSGCGGRTAVAPPSSDIVAPVAASATAPAPARLLPLDADARRWVDSTLRSLTPRAKAAQLVVAWTSGRYQPVDSDGYEQLRHWVEDVGVGGIIISIGPPVSMAAELNRLQRLADVPLLVSTDMEHGPAQRLQTGVLLPWGSSLGGGTWLPPVMAIGATGDPDLAYQLGRVTALEGRAVGIHLNFAPVADVNNNPANPIINTRSYGQDPARVAAMVEAQVRGLQDHGMLATAKHFPGHGDVSQDSHLVPLIVRFDAARADSVELVPFRAAVAAGAAGVMTAHIAFPGLSGDSTLPATLSPRMLDSLLVRELGFDGLVITDALNMGAIVKRFGPEEAAVLALEAGADILLQPIDPTAAAVAVADAVERGRIAEARLDRSVRKVLEAKARVGLHRDRTVDVEAVAERVGLEEHRSLAREVAERSLTLVRDQSRLVPLAGGRVLSIAYTDDVDPFVGRAFHATLRDDDFARLEAVTLGPNPHPAVLDSVRAQASAADRVVFVADVRVRSSKGSVAIEEPVAAMVRDIAATTPTIAVSLGNPYLLTQFPQVGTYLVAWGGGEPSQVAAARALLGELPITGRLPISIPPLHGAGEGLQRRVEVAGERGGSGAQSRSVSTAGVVTAASDRVPAARQESGLHPAALAEIDRAIEAAIEARVTPGAALAIGRRSGPVRLRSYGALTYAPASPAVTDSTLYDLASLTKVVGTTTALMLLVERGAVELEAPLSRYIREWPRGGWRDGVTLRSLLLHSGGLPPFIRFWHPDAGALRGSDAVVAAIMQTPAAYPPGTRTVYSDLGAILLGEVVERVSGQELDDFLDAEVWSRLDMRRTGFNPIPELIPDEPAAPLGEPARRDLAPLERIAPTEDDRVFRNAVVHGVVHDENAYAMGGVAGHAGLFSTADDLATFARMMLRGGRYGAVRLLLPETIGRFTGAQPDSDRALGWDRPPGAGDMADALSDRAFGHTGFTGTSLWVDPELDLFVVLLTNRVHPTREGSGIGQLRRTVHRLAASAAGGASGGDSQE